MAQDMGAAEESPLLRRAGYFGVHFTANGPDMLRIIFNLVGPDARFLPAYNILLL
ncbi:hypothetical protein J6590_089148, partial [Homalodisca vitripennis]